MGRRKRKKANKGKSDGKVRFDSAATTRKGGILSVKLVKMLSASMVIIAAGYFLLYKTDSLGKNVYAVLAPFLLIVGYSIVAFGLFND